jgi:hypothetical protein
MCQHDCYSILYPSQVSHFCLFVCKQEPLPWLQGGGCCHGGDRVPGLSPLIPKKWTAAVATGSLGS